jgi:hypothetical protein
MSADVRVRWRLPLSDERFIAWLNAQSDAGWQLLASGSIRYRFVRGVPGQYRYLAHVLPGLLQSPERAEYVQMLRGMKVEVVSTVENTPDEVGHAILRYPTSCGDLELESDLASRMAQARYRMGANRAAGGIAALVVVGCAIIGVIVADQLRRLLERPGVGNLDNPVVGFLVTADAVLWVIALVVGVAMGAGQLREWNRGRRDLARLERESLLYE